VKEKSMHTAKRYLAFLVAILLVLTAVFGMMMFTLEQRGFSPDTYQRTLANEGFYKRLPKVLAELVNSSAINQSDLPMVMQGMRLEAWEAFFRILLPPDTLKTMGNEALDSTFAYLNMETNSAEISLLPLKKTMTSDAGVQAIFALLSTQPDCTLAQVAQMTVNLLGAEDIQFCNPPPEFHPVLTPVIERQMQLTSRAIPDRITLASPEQNPGGEDTRVGLNNLRGLMRMVPLIPLGLLLVLTLLMVNSLNSWLDWWGGPSLATGILAMLMSLSSVTVIGGLLRRSITQNAPTYLPEALSVYAGDLATAMVATLTRPILWQGILLAIIGGVMIGTSFIIRRRNKNLPPSEQETIVD
jgi:hypothetical protein